jgi:plastocyanin
MRQRILPALVTLLLAAPAARAATVHVEAFNFAFFPAEVTINVGDTVMWTGLAGGGHNVVADDLSFDSGSAATFQHTFNSAGSFPYVCLPHESLGMTGVVNVSGGGGGGEQRGTLKLAGTAFNVPEGNSINLQVMRVNGDDGAVSVSWAVVAGTAQTADFSPGSGNLIWADGDDDPKILTVATVEDAAVEGNETVRVFLSNPAGGAALDGTAREATVTIQDDDSGGAAPTTPTGLQAHGHSASEVMLSWNDASGETGYRIEARTFGGSFQEVATAPANAASATVGGLAEATFYTFRIRAENGTGFSGYSNEAEAATFATPGPCFESAHSLCLSNGRFQVQMDWRAGTSPVAAATAIPLDFAPESGLFYFASPSNIEVLVKVLNACVPALGNKYWVFYAATTNLEFTLTVVDTQTGAVRIYHNPANTAAAPVQDTNAFATCP